MLIPIRDITTAMMQAIGRQGRPLLITMSTLLMAPGIRAEDSRAEEIPGWRVTLRPHAGPTVTTVGRYTRSDGMPWALGAFAGLRLLVGPDSEHAFGLEGTWLSTGLARGEGLRDVALLGPVAEVRVWRLVHLDAGLLYAREMNDERRGYADLSYSVGFAPAWWPHWTPMIVYRSDLIFTSALTSVRALSFGIGYTF